MNTASHAERIGILTGGACGLLMPSTARYSALVLCLLLVAVFPANVHAAGHAVTIGGRPVLGLWPRTLLQVVFIAATVIVLVTGG